MHVESQPSCDMRLPSSHCSPVSCTPLPHCSVERQSARQPSPDRWLPSSHCSPLSTTRLPQPSARHTPSKHSPVADECFDGDRKSTRLNSSHGYISYPVCCLKKRSACSSAVLPWLVAAGSLGRGAGGRSN